MVAAGVVLVLLIGVTVAVCWRSRGLLGPALVLLLAILWLLADRPMEGPTLWVADRGHGLTLADLLSPICVIVAAAVVRPRRRQSRSCTQIGTPGET